jgi:hypothetical protein
MDFFQISFREMIRLFLIATALASERNPLQPMGGPGNIVSIKSAIDFCFFLPPVPNITIAESEGYPLASPEEVKKWAVSHCTKSNSDAPKHQYFYDGFITGAHYKKTDQYVQITGTLDATKAAIPMDGGGFYDLDSNVNSPPGGMCAGYDSFFNVVNPIDGIFCIKCCVGIMSCDITNWAKGCSGLVPGDYSSSFDGEKPPNSGRTLSNDVKPSDPKPNSASKLNASVLLASLLLIANQ